MLLVLVVTALTISGCSKLLKMPEAFHEMEVARLDVIRSSLEAAKAKEELNAIALNLAVPEKLQLCAIKDLRN